MSAQISYVTICLRSASRSEQPWYWTSCVVLAMTWSPGPSRSSEQADKANSESGMDRTLSLIRSRFSKVHAHA